MDKTQLLVEAFSTIYEYWRYGEAMREHGRGFEPTCASGMHVTDLLRWMACALQADGWTPNGTNGQQRAAEHVANVLRAMRAGVPLAETAEPRPRMQFPQGDK